MKEEIAQILLIIVSIVLLAKINVFMEHAQIYLIIIDALVHLDLLEKTVILKLMNVIAAHAFSEVVQI
jgi:hypothetical protein